MYHDTNQEIHLASHTIHAKVKCICGAYDVASVIRFCWLLVLHFLAMVAPRDGVSLKMPPKKRVLDKTAVGAFKAGVNIFQLPRKARKSRHAAHESGSRRSTRLERCTS